MQKAVDIGQYFLNIAREANVELTTMHILKLVYIAHGWMLGIHGRPLIRENVEAWRYGPVIPELYERIKHTRGEVINEDIVENLPKLDSEEEEMIEETFDNYHDFEAWQLSNITHVPGTPWDVCYKNKQYVISPGVIADYYRKKALEDD